ncbi:hypothetical protein CEXT_771961 [Caerostris extrusa]|uniref:Uncharacterized protein n=1 Tax=Caerostris extrusa TaxID=172846 RepID=A0AAV4UMQ2_CAEEX|nr:hypothetical protein CEXT_771961 [Caerostris extrusa]
MSLELEDSGPNLEQLRVHCLLEISNCSRRSEIMGASFSITCRAPPPPGSLSLRLPGKEKSLRISGVLIAAPFAATKSPVCLQTILISDATRTKGNSTLEILKTRLGGKATCSEISRQ